MPLLADRFVMGDDRYAVDLATGSRVFVALSSAGSEREQERWALRCDTLQKLHHPSVARLIDYGVVGKSQRFEAWQDAAAIENPSMAPAISHGDSAVWTNLEYAADSSKVSGRLDLPVEERGILKIERPAVAVLGELLELSDELRPRVAALWAPENAGKYTALLDLARIARVRGFVPLSASLVSAWGQRLAGRSLLILDTTNQKLGWSALLSASLTTPRPHVLLFIGRNEVPGVDSVHLEPLSAEALVAAVYPPVNDVDRARIQQLAAEAQGWPGRFSQLLWHGRGSR